MNNEGKTLEQLLEAENESVEVELSSPASTDKMVPLNAQIPETIMRDLRIISAYTDTSIKEIVAKEIGRFVKRAKKKMVEEMTKP